MLCCFVCTAIWLHMKYAESFMRRLFFRWVFALLLLYLDVSRHSSQA